MGCDGEELSILLTANSEIAELNWSYRKKKGATDVLSFSLREESHGAVDSGLLGDVVISVETAAEQALKQRLTLEQELLRLLIHGVLHLVGYDHERVTERKKRLMQRKEQQLFRQLRPIFSAR